jgi:hypothetical protein
VHAPPDVDAPLGLPVIQEPAASTDVKREWESMAAWMATKATVRVTTAPASAVGVR